MEQRKQDRQKKTISDTTSEALCKIITAGSQIKSYFVGVRWKR